MKAEILAPAGSPEALVAAVRAGADAVYLGASGFNARQNARGFTSAELAEAVGYCHAHGVRVHVALNTLVREEELPAALKAAETAADLGVDALILQDMGLARCLRQMMPEMPLHASTQLSCHTPEGVRFLQEAGFSRVVLSREMSIEEIAACAAVGPELEVFVHGALCMSVSGQCYFSAMLGGRSGNRGRCAQTCRLPFCPSDCSGTPASEQYAMSLRDLSAASHFRALCDAGVVSFKIEGRMKRPEYVAAATAVYAALRDGKPVTDAELQRLQDVFSRSGFTDGYITGRREDMFGHRRYEDVTAAESVLRELRRLYDREVPRMGVSVHLEANLGEPITLRVWDERHEVVVTGEVATDDWPELPIERIEAQLSKTGGTPFCVREVAVRGNGTYAVSALNTLRREALAKLEEAYRRPQGVRYSKNIPPIEKHVSLSLWRQGPPRLLVRVASADRLTEAVRAAADVCFVPLGEILNGGEWGVEIPRGLFDTEASLRHALKAARDAGATYALCGNVGAVPLAKEEGLLPLGGFGLNLTNAQAVAAYAEKGLAAATLSMELTFGQMAFSKEAPIPCGALLYGRQPLMLTRNCPRRAALGPAACADCAPQDGVTDRRGVTFPTACMGGCTELLNSVPLWWADKLSELPPLDFWLLHFTVETPLETEAVVRAYCEGGKPPAEITRGLYRRGVE